ncbi:lytic murein transglycosylase [Candidatus Azambacteria bacterium]|nr:lytic murein transglycosylase [Candidatus Azambacteria bacterium]
MKNNLQNQIFVCYFSILKTSLESQIENLETKITDTKKEQKSLKNELKNIDFEIQKQILEERALNISLKEIDEDITFKNGEINKLNTELDKKKNLLKEAVKELNGYDKISWFELLLKGGDISDVFGQINNIHQLQKQANGFIQSIDDIRTNLESEKSSLEDKKRDNIRLGSLTALQQASLSRKKNDKKILLQDTQGNEEKYKSIISKNKKDIALIKQQLYKLEDVGVSMSFEEAYNKAKFVGEKTGLRPAFILGLFQVESKMGTYIGGGSWQKDLYQCYIGLGKRQRAEDEKSAYLEITSSLGLDPDSMPVSKKLSSVGCGGAMGAAQFMPTTWMSFKNQISSLTGHNPPSPWNIEDAFMGSAIKLSNNDANSQSVQSEKKAAAMYYAGARWQKYPGQNYARQVLEWADYYQEQINAIESGPLSIKF